jgi:hypothetical protein
VGIYLLFSYVEIEFGLPHYYFSLSLLKFLRAVRLQTQYLHKALCIYKSRSHFLTRKPFYETALS